jgi:hypothetical protein
MKKQLLFIILFLLPFSIFAQGISRVSKTEDVLPVFQQYKDIPPIDSAVAVVVEAPFEEYELPERTVFAVVNTADQTLEPYYYNRETAVVPLVPAASHTRTSAQLMTDGIERTYTEFILPEDSVGETVITIVTPQPITSSSVTMLLDKNVALPVSIELQAVVDGEMRMVLARSKMKQNTILFPQTESARWVFTLRYTQPLRISELRFSQELSGRKTMQGVRFLARPYESYRIYFDADRFITVSTGEGGNYAVHEGVLLLSPASAQQNPMYRPSDSDKDGIPDLLDNCVSVENADQADRNGNSRGDACDDFDRDGVLNIYDNCLENPNRNQRDEDGDGIGDVCDKEESRLTERYGFIPWIGISIAALVLILLIIYTARGGGFLSTQEPEPEEPHNNTPL